MLAGEEEGTHSILEVAPSLHSSIEGTTSPLDDLAVDRGTCIQGDEDIVPEFWLYTALDVGKYSRHVVVIGPVNDVLSERRRACGVGGRVAKPIELAKEFCVVG